MQDLSYATRLPLSPAVRLMLESVVRRSSSPQSHALRARLLLEMAEGGSNPEIAARFDVHPSSVRTLRQRWQIAAADFEPLLADEKALATRVLEILHGKTSPGRPQTFTPEEVAAVVALACKTPESVGVPVTHWTHALLAEEAVRQGLVKTLSASTVGRFLKSGGVKAPSR